MVRISESPIYAESVERGLDTRGAGGIVTFTGIVRDHAESPLPNLSRRIDP